MSPQLAVLGGDPIRTRPFPRRETIGVPERAAVLEVMDGGELSGFFGSPGDRFLGGRRIRAFEARWSEMFGYEHAIAVNSWTTGLTTCVGALGLGPGDEMICPPYTMSASATCGLVYGVVPVFADVDPVTFVLDPQAVEAAITDRTKAIMAVHLFGLPCDMGALATVAERHGLRLVEDAAQAPLATYGGRPVGALRDIGGFSLNYHKHVHTGEGGMIVTDDSDLADRCRLIRNHGENAVEAWGVTDLTNMVGSNYRLTELQAAIGLGQLDRVADIVARRRALAGYLAGRLKDCEALGAAVVPDDRTHSFYVYPLRYDAEAVGISRAAFTAAVNAELPLADHPDDVPLSEGYVRPLYLSPLFQRQVAIGPDGFPFNLVPGGVGRYQRGACPVAERLYDEELLLSSLVRDPLSEDDIEDLLLAIDKVTANAGALRHLE